MRLRRDVVETSAPGRKRGGPSIFSSPENLRFHLTTTINGRTGWMAAVLDTIHLCVLHPMTVTTCRLLEDDRAPKPKKREGAEGGKKHVKEDPSCIYIPSV